MSDLSFSILHECTIAFDTVKREVIFASPNTESILGYKPGCFFGNPSLLFDMIDEEFRRDFEKKLDDLGKNEQLEQYYPIKTENGDKIWVRDRKSVTTGAAEDGQTILLSVFSLCCPEGPDAHNEALVREQFLNSLLDSQTNFIIRFNTSGAFTFANNQFLKKLGYEKDELMGRHFSVVTLPEEMDLCLKALAYALKNPGEVVPLANKKRDKAGNVFDTEWEFVAVTDDAGNVVAIQGIGRDITQWLASEKAIFDQNERLRHIASLTSHELRRPVASMLGLINLLDRANFFNPENQQIIEYMFAVGNEIDEAIRLVVDGTAIGDPIDDNKQAVEKYQVR